MSELAHRQTDQAGSGLQAFTPDPERAMLALGLHPNNPLTHAALLLANTYGLDPLLGHIKIIPGKGSQPATIWIPRDGYLFKALQHPEWAGMDLLEEDDGGGPPDGVYFCRVVCRRKGQPDQEGRAWYKWRQAKANGGTYIDENADEMCLQRAERRALRRQFPLSIFELDVHVEDGEPVAAPAAVVEVAHEGRARRSVAFEQHRVAGHARGPFAVSHQQHGRVMAGGLLALVKRTREARRAVVLASEPSREVPAPAPAAVPVTARTTVPTGA